MPRHSETNGANLIPKTQSEGLASRNETKGTSDTGLFSSTLLSFGQTSSTLAKLVNYSPYSLLTSTGSHPNTARADSSQSNSTSRNSTDISNYNQLSILHRTLYARNQQLHACLNHLYKHPFDKASKDIHTISQRLVDAQKSLQEIERSVMKIKREQRCLNMNVNMIV